MILLSGIATIVLLFFIVALWLAIVIAMALNIYGSLISRVPFVPISRPVVEALKKEMPLGQGCVFYDLGCGDGRIVLAMAKEFPQAQATGIEKAPLPYLLSRFFHNRKPLKNASFVRADFGRIDLSDATHVYLYLYPSVVRALLPKLRSELKAGTRVVSCDFPFNALEPARAVIIGTGRKSHTLYFYDFP